MVEIVKMPKLSDTMEEGVIANWLVKEGDSVEEGDVIAEIETDKATMDYEAPVDGTILKIVAEPGIKYSLSQAICVIGDKGEDFDLEAAESTSSDKPDSKPGKQSTEQSKPAPSKTSTAPSQNNSLRIKASPLAKKVAVEKGIDLASVNGSGPSGRIIVRDLEGASSTQAPAQTQNIAPAVASGGYEDKNNSMMRLTIAKRLHAAKNDAPHFYLTRSCRMETMLKLRQDFNADESQPRVSVNDMIMQACAKALKKHPNINASWQGDYIRTFHDVHVAMAVALPEGLITPVVRHCDQIGVREIAKQTKSLAGLAKEGKLQTEDYSGGTFTVSNLGMMGIEEFTAIINPPQSAILAVGATMEVPWVEDGLIEVQKRMKMTMSCDHRVIDGAAGAAFLQTLCAYIENPMLMLS